MNANRLIKLGYFALFFPTLCIAAPPQYNLNNAPSSRIQINQSVYILDKNLIQKGYKIENINNEAVLLFQGRPVSAAYFNMPGVEGDKAMKLFIEIKDAIKNAVIYLNNVSLQLQTDKSGSAYVDLYRVRGKYFLKLENTVLSVTYKYYFELDKPLKLLCRGTNNFDCKKIYY